MAENKKSTKKTIGFDIEMPQPSTVVDRKSPFSGDRNIRGRTFVGKVIRAKVQKTAIVESEGKRYVPKYERDAKVRTRLMVHNPPEIDAKEGDLVLAYETRKISKRKNYVIVKILESKEK